VSVEQSLIKIIEWYRDRYHNNDFCHTEIIERIKKIDEQGLQIYEQLVDSWFDNESPTLAKTKL
jgi:hypothetical protein